MFSSGQWVSLRIHKYIHRMHTPHTYPHTLKKREKEMEEGGKRRGGKKKKRRKEEEKEERREGGRRVMGRRGKKCLT